MVSFLRMLSATLVLVTTIPTSASSTPAATTSAQRLERIGYVIEAEPEVVRHPTKGLVTRAILWRLRAHYRTGAGLVVRVSPDLPPGLRSVTRDTEVVVERRWTPADQPRLSKYYEGATLAARDYKRMRFWTTLGGFGHPIQTLRKPAGVPVASRAPSAGTPIPATKATRNVTRVETPVISKRGWPKCKDVLIEQGHAAMHLSKCDGIPNECAVTLLENGHSPIHLGQCKQGQNTECMLALLRKGHSPIHLGLCSGLRDGKCAAKLLERGDSPTSIRNCQ